MKTVAIDLDGVLYRWHESLYEYFRLYRGFDGTYLEFWTNFYKTLSDEEFNYLIGIDTLYSNMIPTKNCKEFLNQVKDRFEIYYLTSRPESVRTTTEIYLNRHDFPFKDNLIITKDKVNFARKLRLSYAIDDSKIQVEELSKVTFTILIAQPWNKDIQLEYPTAYGVLDALKYMED